MRPPAGAITGAMNGSGIEEDGTDGNAALVVQHPPPCLSTSDSIRETGIPARSSSSIRYAASSTVTSRATRMSAGTFSSRGNNEGAHPGNGEDRKSRGGEVRGRRISSVQHRPRPLPRDNNGALNCRNRGSSEARQCRNRGSSLGLSSASSGNRGCRARNSDRRGGESRRGPGVKGKDRGEMKSGAGNGVIDRLERVVQGRKIL